MSISSGGNDVADIEFDAEGAALRGWLYRPRAGGSAAPVVVMAHGYNCLKELYLDKYAAAIASAGHVVLAYDHRNFGRRYRRRRFVRTRARTSIHFPFTLRTLQGTEELAHRIHPHADWAATLTMWDTGLM